MAISEQQFAQMVKGTVHEKHVLKELDYTENLQDTTPEPKAPEPSDLPDTRLHKDFRTGVRVFAVWTILSNPWVILLVVATCGVALPAVILSAGVLHMMDKYNGSMYKFSRWVLRNWFLLLVGLCICVRAYNTIM